MTRGALIALIGSFATAVLIFTGYVVIFAEPATPGAPPEIQIVEGTSTRPCEEDEVLDPTVDCVRPAAVVSTIGPCLASQAADPSVNCLAAVAPDAIEEASEHPLIEVEETPTGYVLILPGGQREEIEAPTPSELDHTLANLQGDWEVVDVQLNAQTSSGVVSSRSFLTGGLLRVSGNRWFFDEKPAGWNTELCNSRLEAQAPGATTINPLGNPCDLTCEVTGPAWFQGTLDIHRRTSLSPDIGPAATMFQIPLNLRDQEKFQYSCASPGDIATVSGDAVNPLALVMNIWGMELWAEGNGSRDADGNPYLFNAVDRQDIDSLVLHSVMQFGDVEMYMTLAPVR